MGIGLSSLLEVHRFLSMKQILVLFLRGKHYKESKRFPEPNK